MTNILEHKFCSSPKIPNISFSIFHIFVLLQNYYHYQQNAIFASNRERDANEFKVNQIQRKSKNKFGINYSDIQMNF